ncbi:MAG: DUF4116 domain-containing protein [Elusimicrobiota bacterium]|nr:DUF4116 domain-containing protein [Elusimicrobiota bacterium]
MTQKTANIIAVLAIVGLAAGYYLAQYRKSGAAPFQPAVASTTATTISQPSAEKTAGTAGPLPSGDSLSLISGETASQTAMSAEGELDRPEGMEWFYKRFGNSTWFAEGTFNAKSFTPQEYETLIAAALQGNESATVALKLSILKYLIENPKDAEYKAVKEKLYSEEFLKTVPRFEYLAEMLPDELLDNKDFAADILAKNPYNLKFFSERLRSDKEIVSKVISNNIYLLELASDALRNDKAFIKELLLKDPTALSYISDELKGDKDLVLPVLKGHPELYSAASSKVQNDPEVLPLIRTFILTGGRGNVSALPEKLRGDREVVMKAVESNCSLLESASVELRDDEEVVSKAIAHSRYCLQYASSRLREKLKQPGQTGQEEVE